MKKRIKVENKDNSAMTLEISWEMAAALGYTGRDQEKVKEHIEELEKLNVSPPYAVPAVYWIDPNRIEISDKLYVVGGKTSGEIEFFVAFDDEDILFTVASDHTDRELESVSISKSKQICSKIIAERFWRYDEVKEHFDEIVLRCFVKDNGGEFVLYQEGVLGDILTIDDLIEVVKSELIYNGERFCFFSGTLPILTGETIFGKEYKLEMTDPILGRSISHRYKVIELPER